jgi:para-nitrobenzyl esterase
MTKTAIALRLLIAAAATHPLRAALSDPVKLTTGLVAGLTAGDTRVYKGIPFAAAPVGSFRWKPPQPVAPWEGVRACLEFGAWCPQPKSIIGAQFGERQSEDCLYLNVWTAAETATAKLPVMVWIHGGGCTTGSGAAAAYDGAALARQGVVVVTIN